MNSFNGVAFNGVDQIREKTEFVIENGYGGMQIWELSHDIPYSNEMSLLRTMRKAIDEAHRF
jgi:GH18 family chitinase